MKTLFRVPLFALAFIAISIGQAFAIDSTYPLFAVNIEKTHNTPFGQIEDVRIYLDNSVDPGNAMGHFEFLIEYDYTVLSLSSVDPGQLITDCGWEYFTYRFGANGNCGGNACPSGKVHIVAIAETNDGNNHPSCFGETPAASSDLAILHFVVTNDYNMECLFFPISFIWYDCGDNVISSRTGDTSFISRHVYDIDSFNPPIEDINQPFPSLFGANSSCDTLQGNGQPVPLRGVDFYNGGIDIECIDIIDDPGDINLNGVAYEIADWVLFSNYFIYGLSVFTIDPAVSIAVSDVNLDGEVLKLEDLVLLQRIISGDNQPLLDPFDSTSPNLATFTQRTDPVRNGVEVIDVTTPDTLGVIQLIFSGEIIPTSLNSSTELYYAFANGLTKVLVWVWVNPYNSLDSNFILQGPLISFTGNGDFILAQTATNKGVKVISSSCCCCKGIRGDANIDGTDANILDLTFLVDFIFRGSNNTGLCPAESNINGDGSNVADILDLTFLIDRIFRGGPAPGACAK